MDPETRTIMRVQIEDAAIASNLFDRLMGDEVEPRREFIEKNAKYVKNLDVFQTLAVTGGCSMADSATGCQADRESVFVVKKGLPEAVDACRGRLCYLDASLPPPTNAPGPMRRHWSCRTAARSNHRGGSRLEK
jgi:hypothetical protein